MRTPLIFIIFCFPFLTLAQKYNDLKPLNTFLEDSLIIIKASTTYDNSKFILYTNSCSSETEHIIYTLGFEKQKPTMYRCTFRYQYFGIGLYNRKLSVRKLKLGKGKIETFETKMNQYNLSELKTDSLNESIYFKDGEKYGYLIKGCIDKFVIVNGLSDISKIEAVGVGELQSKLHSQQRSNFISIRDAFNELLK